METYPVDLEARQIVRWLVEEQRRGTLQLNALATRSYVVEGLEEQESQRLGEEDEDLNDVLAIGLLEIRPPAAKDGWVLRVRVEDRIGPRLPEDEDAPEGEEEIDLATFEAEFFQPERGTAEVLLDAEDAQAKARFTRVLKQMLNDKHRDPAGR
ncbi:MAG: hypothetical protein ACLP7P_05170 [Rhodomicrobium sp.]